MTKSTTIIESPWPVGTILYLTDLGDAYSSRQGALDKMMQSCAVFDAPMPDLAPSIQVRVIGIRMNKLVKLDSGGVEYQPTKSVIEEQYKVVRTTADVATVVLISKEATEVKRLSGAHAIPFHDAFDFIDRDGTKLIRQIIYVNALCVDGNYKLLEVLDDQDW